MMAYLIWSPLHNTGLPAYPPMLAANTHTPTSLTLPTEGEYLGLHCGMYLKAGKKLMASRLPLRTRITTWEGLGWLIFSSLRTSRPSEACVCMCACVKLGMHSGKSLSQILLDGRALVSLCPDCMA